MGLSVWRNLNGSLLLAGTTSPHVHFNRSKKKKKKTCQTNAQQERKLEKGSRKIEVRVVSGKKRVKRLNPHPADNSPFERDDVGGLVRNMSDTFSVLHTLSSPQYIYHGGLVAPPPPLLRLILDFNFSTISSPFLFFSFF